MDQSLSKKDNSPDDQVSILQREIAALEAEIDKVKKDLDPLEIAIRTKLSAEISRIRNLSELYKKQKAQKKVKRLEQKKRGKNYKEPKPVRYEKRKEEGPVFYTPEEHKELKRIYKEALVRVHPDKIHHIGEGVEIEKATAVTVELNNIYKSGDLEELIHFYQEVVSRNSDSNKGLAAKAVADPKARLLFLNRKKEVMAAKLEEVKTSYLYEIVTTYENPLSFIGELQKQFQERIKQLEKRTRKR